MAKQPGFATLLMQLLDSNVDNAVKVAASIQLKHFIEHNWEDKIGAAEKKQFRGMIVDLMLKHTPAVARQLRATLEIVANADWPGSWPGAAAGCWCSGCRRRSAGGRWASAWTCCGR